MSDNMDMEETDNFYDLYERLEKSKRREIKFEAWNPYRNVMISWDYIRTHKEMIFSTDYKWRQYIGLKDKNKVEIYEGDIVSINIRDKNEVVRWEEKSCGFEPFSDSLDNCGHCGGGVNPESYDIEVIGNIYESPELLK